MDDKYRYRNIEIDAFLCSTLLHLLICRIVCRTFIYVECWISNKHVEFKWIFSETIISKTGLRTHHI